MPTVGRGRAGELANDNPRYLDFHTHPVGGQSPLDCAVYSISLPLLPSAPPVRYYTTGLHPWDTGMPQARQLVEQQLPQALIEPQCVAVGEVGLDRLRGAPLAEQIRLLEIQLGIAQLASRPVVMHCVRAWSELEASIRRAHYQGAVALHGFQGHCPVLHHLLDRGWYISVKPRPDGTLPAQLVDIPDEQLLLETDALPIPIAQVYQQAASLRGITLAQCQQLVLRNASAFFNMIF